MRINWLLCALWALLPACGREQWLVSLYTDASVPQFGDRVRIELLDDRGNLICPGCQHTVEAGDPGRWPLSFGVSPELSASGAGLHVRARLFRADHLDAGALGDPLHDGAYLDALGKLPAEPGRVRLALRMDCFRVAAMTPPLAFESCDPASGASAPEVELSPDEVGSAAPRPGSWQPGRDRPCSGAPPGMVCMNGGAFMMGGLSYLGAPARSHAFAAEPETLVILGPFAIDQDEFTVGDLARLRGQQAGVPVPILRGQAGDPNALCTATGGAADANSRMPLNCVTWAQADELCRRLGKRLPTEAEWEFAAGNGTQETDYPWGASGDVCGYAVVSRGSTQFDENQKWIGATDCRVGQDEQLQPWGPQAGGHPLDASALGVRNQGGNVSEWCADGFTSYEAACPGRTTQRTWQINPLCQPASSSLAVVRGSNWMDRRWLSRAVQRYAANRAGASAGVGFRCAQPMGDSL